MSRAIAAVSVRDALDGARTAIAAAGSPSVAGRRAAARRRAGHDPRWRREPDAPLTPAATRTFRSHVTRRAREREPVAYILGRRAFRRLELAVDPRVLIPRPETELLVELALELPHGAAVLDCCTGSGAIALALADERPDLRLSGSDVDEGALAVARANGARLRLAVDWRLADLLDGLPDAYDAIVANAPYVERAAFAGSNPRSRATSRAGHSTAAPGARRARGADRPGGGDARRHADPRARRHAGRRRRGCVRGRGLHRGRAPPRPRRAPARRARAAVSDPSEALRCVAAGGVALFGADTVYGLCCDPPNAAAVDRLFALKGRPRTKPAALAFFTLDPALAALPELGERTRAAFHALLPGPLTLLVPNPARRFPLAGGELLGVRVIDVGLELDAPVLQSSANLTGGPDPRTLARVPASDTACYFADAQVTMRGSLR